MQQSIPSRILKQDLFSHHWSRVQVSSLYARTSATAFSWAIIKPSPLKSDFSGLSHSGFCTPRPSVTQNPIVAARKNRRRIGWQRAARAAVQYVLLIASDLKVLPEPIDVVIREAFGAGHGGGGSGIWKGLGWGGFEGWGKSRWRVKFGVFRLLGVCALVILLGISRKPESDLACGVLGLFLLGSLVWDCQKAMKGWVLGFCSCALVMILGLRIEHLQMRIKGLRVRSPFIKIARARRR